MNGLKWTMQKPYTEIGSSNKRPNHWLDCSYKFADVFNFFFDWYLIYFFNTRHWCLFLKKACAYCWIYSSYNMPLVSFMWLSNWKQITMAKVNICPIPWEPLEKRSVISWGILLSLVSSFLYTWDGNNHSPKLTIFSLIKKFLNLEEFIILPCKPNQLRLSYCCYKSKTFSNIDINKKVSFTDQQVATLF